MKIRLESVSFAYPSGVRALDGVSLGVGSGETVAILGENGAGKTTLARHLNGLLRPSSGTIAIGDWQAAQHSIAELSSRVGYVFQNPDDQLFAQTVGEELAFGPKNLGWEPGEVNTAVAAALAQTGLAESIDRHPYDLTGPERKFVALAATLAMRTPILVLDEPTTGLDAYGVARMSGVVTALQRTGVTVLIISHDVDFCAEHAERVVVMSRGQVVAQGGVGEVFLQEQRLRQSGLHAPQLIRLAHALGMQAGPTNPEDFVQAYARHRGLRP